MAHLASNFPTKEVVLVRHVPLAMSALSPKKFRLRVRKATFLWLETSPAPLAKQEKFALQEPLKALLLPLMKCTLREVNPSTRTLSLANSTPALKPYPTRVPQEHTLILQTQAPAQFAQLDPSVQLPTVITFIFYYSVNLNFIEDKIQCPAGYFSGRGAIACTPCPPGTSCPSAGTTIADLATNECEIWEFSLQYATSCVACPAGYECLSKGEIPSFCSVGSTAEAGATPNQSECTVHLVNGEEIITMTTLTASACASG